MTEWKRSPPGGGAYTVAAAVGRQGREWMRRESGRTSTSLIANERGPVADLNRCSTTEGTEGRAVCRERVARDRRQRGGREEPVVSIRKKTEWEREQQQEMCGFGQLKKGVGREGE